MNFNDYIYRAFNLYTGEIVDTASFRNIIEYARYEARQAEYKTIEIKIYRKGEYLGSVFGHWNGITYSGPFGRDSETYYNNLMCEVAR